ncbi:MAG: ABC transporter permease [Lachnospiraceae bacterium]|nr:ABC transporter permease [Lachnospiraceae bacterium]
MNQVKAILKSNVMLLILIALVIIFGIGSENFLTAKNLLNICTQNAYFIVASIGVGMIMISGGTDLSVGYCMSVISVCMAVFMQRVGLAWPLAVILGLIIGVALGAFNGFASNLLRIHPMIVTLATMTMFQGISFTISESKSFFNFDEAFVNIGQGYLGPISFPIIFAIIIAVVIHFILEMTCFGRFIYAAGGNPEAARLAGINVKRVKVYVFMIGGFLYAIAALLLTARGGSANSSIGPGTEFNAITACVLGGVSFIGGEGKVKGVVIGCLILGVLSNGMQLIGLGVYIQYIVKGIILMLSIGYDTYSKQAKVKKVASAEKAAA